jgi:hypothetical protein
MTPLESPQKARETVTEIPGEITKTARDLVGDYLDISDRRAAQLAKLVATALHEAVKAEGERCEVAVAMACHVGKYTPLSEYIAAIRAAPKSEGA